MRGTAMVRLDYAVGSPAQRKWDEVIGLATEEVSAHCLPLAMPVRPASLWCEILASSPTLGENGVVPSLCSGQPAKASSGKRGGHSQRQGQSQA